MAIVDANYQSTNIPSLHKGNPLIESLPPVPSDMEILVAMTNRPQMDRDEALKLQTYIRMYELDLLRQLFLPHPISNDYFRQIDMVIRGSYAKRNPLNPTHQKYIYDIQKIVKDQGAHSETTAAMMTLKGSSGLGKTRLTKVALAIYPQVIRHTVYNGVKLAELQIVWLSVEAPIGGALRGFVLSLFEAIDIALGLTDSESAYGKRNRKRASYDELIREFVQIAASHSLGILHIDDIQRIADTTTDREYVMQTIIRLANVAGFAVLFTGTEDISKVIKTMTAKGKSSHQTLPQTFEIARRIVSEGHFEIQRALSFNEPYFKMFTTLIFKYQWLEKPLGLSDTLREALWMMSAGIPSILMMLHRLAQREALSIGASKLLGAHYRMAHDKYLGPLIPLLKAIREGKTLTLHENREFEKYFDELNKI
jgi:AAA domain